MQMMAVSFWGSGMDRVQLGMWQDRPWRAVCRNQISRQQLNNMKSLLVYPWPGGSLRGSLRLKFMDRAPRLSAQDVHAAELTT